MNEYDKIIGLAYLAQAQPGTVERFGGYENYVNFLSEQSGGQYTPDDINSRIVDMGQREIRSTVKSSFEQSGNPYPYQDDILQAEEIRSYVDMMEFTPPSLTPYMQAYDRNVMMANRESDSTIDQANRMASQSVRSAETLASTSDDDFDNIIAGIADDRTWLDAIGDAWKTIPASAVQELGYAVEGSPIALAALRSATDIPSGANVAKASLIAEIDRLREDGSSVAEAGEAITEWAQKYLPESQQATFLDQIFMGVGQMGVNIAAYAIPYVGRAVGPITTALSYLGREEEYAREQGISAEETLPLYGGAVISAASEQIPISRAFGRMAKMEWSDIWTVPRMRRFGASAITQGLEEGVQEFGQSIWQNTYRGEAVDFQQAWEGGKVGFVLGGMFGAGGRYVSERSVIKRADHIFSQATAEQIAELERIAAPNTPVRDRITAYADWHNRALDKIEESGIEGIPNDLYLIAGQKVVNLSENTITLDQTEVTDVSVDGDQVSITVEYRDENGNLYQSKETVNRVEQAQAVPAEPAPAMPIPAEPAPVEPAPAEPAPTEPAPVEPTPVAETQGGQIIISAETVPGYNTGILRALSEQQADYDTRLEFHEASDRALVNPDTGNDIILEEMGIADRVRPQSPKPSAYINSNGDLEVNPTTIWEGFDNKEDAILFGLIRGQLTSQEAIAGAEAKFVSDEDARRLAVEEGIFSNSMLIGGAEITKEFAEGLVKVASEADLNVAFYPTDQGALVVHLGADFDGNPNPSDSYEFDEVIAEYARQNGANVAVGQSETFYEPRGGEGGFAEKIREAAENTGRSSDLLQRVLDRGSDNIRALYQEYAKRGFGQAIPQQAEVTQEAEPASPSTPTVETAEAPKVRVRITPGSEFLGGPSKSLLAQKSVQRTDADFDTAVTEALKKLVPTYESHEVTSKNDETGRAVIRVTTQDGTSFDVTSTFGEYNKTPKDLIRDNAKATLQTEQEDAGIQDEAIPDSQVDVDQFKFQVTQDNDVATEEKKKLVQKATEFLSNLYPDFKFVTDFQEFSDAAKKARKDPARVKGFVDTKNNVIYINLEAASLDTPVHEFAHLFVDFLKRSDPKAYNDAKRAVRDTPYYKAAKDAKYKNATEEALVQAIGDQGARMLEGDYPTTEKAQDKQRLRDTAIFNFIYKVKEAVASMFGINPDIDLRTETLADISARYARDIIEGRADMKSDLNPEGSLRDKIYGGDLSSKARVAEDLKKSQSKARSFWRNLMRTGGNMPRELAYELGRAKGEMQNTLAKGAVALDNLTSAIRQEFGNAILSKAQKDAINAALRGDKKALASLPPQTASATIEARAFIDDLSVQITNIDGISDSIKLTIIDNLGVYITKSYRMFDSSDVYADAIKAAFTAEATNAPAPANSLLAQQALNTTRALLSNQYALNHTEADLKKLKKKDLASLVRWHETVGGRTSSLSPSTMKKDELVDYLSRLTDAQKSDAVNRQLSEWVGEYGQSEVSSAFLGAAKAGMSGNKGILMQRSEVTPALAAFLGETADPVRSFADSISKMASLITAAKTQANLVDFAVRNGLARAKSEGVEGAINQEITGTELGILSQYYFDSRMKDVIEEANKSIAGLDADNFIMDFLRQASAVAKAGKTIYSPQAQMRNMLSNIALLTKHGHITSLAGNVGFVKNVVWKDDADLSPQELALKEDLYRLNILNDSSVREIREMLRTSNVTDLDLASGDAGLITSKIASAMGKNVEASERKLRKMYGAVDDFFKTIGYLAETQRYARAVHKTDFGNLEGTQREEISRTAENIVKNLYPTYSRIPRLVRGISKFPLIASFPSYTAEVVRTEVRMWELIRREMRSDNPDLRRLGAKRFGWAASYHSLATYFSVMLAGGLGASLFGIDDEEQDALRVLGAPWEQYQSVLPVSKEDGVVTYTNLSYVLPDANLRDWMIALGNEESPTHRNVVNAVWSLASPYIAPDIAAQALQQVLTNNKGDGRPVYNPDAPLVELTGDVMSHLSKYFNPTMIESFRKITTAYSNGDVAEITGYDRNPELMMISQLGVPFMERNIAQSYGYKLSFDVTKRLNNATAEFNYDIARTNSVEDMRSVYSSYQRKLDAIYFDAKTYTDAAKLLGVSDKEILFIQRNTAGFSDLNFSRFMADGIVPYPHRLRRGERNRFALNIQGKVERQYNRSENAMSLAAERMNWLEQVFQERSLSEMSRAER